MLGLKPQIFGSFTIWVGQLGTFKAGFTSLLYIIQNVSGSCLGLALRCPSTVAGWLYFLLHFSPFFMLFYVMIPI